jgi:CRISPR-associated endonuclease Csn1
MVVPLFEALNRINQDAPVIDRSFHADLGWRFLFSMKVNEMFVFPDEATGFNPADIDLMDPKNSSVISPHLFRVQKLSSSYYCFRHHLETTITDDKELRDVTWKRIQNAQSMLGVIKVRIDHLGRIVGVGEYD